jgi:hypothetical protein
VTAKSTIFLACYYRNRAGKSRFIHRFYKNRQNGGDFHDMGWCWSRVNNGMTNQSIDQFGCGEQISQSQIILPLILTDD